MIVENYTIPSSDYSTDYDVRLVFENGVLSQTSSCDCKHGSFYRFTQDNIKAGKWKCAHITEALRRHDAGDYVPEKIKVAPMKPFDSPFTIEKGGYNVNKEESNTPTITRS